MSLNKKEFFGYDVIKLDSLSNIQDIQEDWIHLLDSSGCVNPYLDPGFYKGLFEFRAGSAVPKIFLFKKNGIPKSIIVGWEKRMKIPFWIGYFKFNSPYLNAYEIEIGGLLAKEESTTKTILLSWLKKMLKEREYDLIIANHFSSANDFFHDLSKGTILGKPVFKLSKEWQAKLRDTNSGESIVQHSSKTLNTFKRKDKKIEKFFNDELEIKEIESEKEISNFLVNVDEISRKSYHLALGVGVENNNYWLKNFLKMASGNYFKGFLLSAGDNPLAFYIGIQHRDTFYSLFTSYKSEFRSLSPGSYLIRNVIKILTKQKVDYFHFGYGDAEHKSLFGNICRDEATFKFFGSSLRALVVKSVDKILLQINERIIENLKGTELIKKIKYAWRNKLRKN